MTPWSRVTNSTIRKYIRDEEENVLRNRKLPAMLNSRGRLTFNWSGTAMDWKVRYKRIKLTPFADGDTLEFSRKDRDKTAVLDWRGYSGTDSMTKGEYLMNRGPEAIIKVYDSIASRLMEDMEDAFAEEFYVNGYAAGNSKRMMGIESFMQANQFVGNGGATPTGSFAGLSCAPGIYGGSWSSTAAALAWPNGKGDAQYDFWSPIIVDVGDTLFSATNTWQANCISAISYGIIKTQKSKSKKGRLDMIMLDEEYFRQYLDVLRTKERIEVNRTADRSPLVALGFTDVVAQDGIDITWEYGITPSTGYGFNVDMMELRSQQAQIWVPEGPDLDIATKSWKFSIDFFGNTVWNPKFFLKLTNLTNPGH